MPIQLSYASFAASTTRLSNKEKQKRPSAIIGLSIGNEVYFASSVRGERQLIYKKASWKGGDGTINPPLPDRFKEVTDALELCRRSQSPQAAREPGILWRNHVHSFVDGRPQESKPKRSQPQDCCVQFKGLPSPLFIGTGRCEMGVLPVDQEDGLASCEKDRQPSE